MDSKYESACKGLGCAPVAWVCQQLATNRQQIVLPGNCKELFSSRLTDVQVVALCEALRGSDVERIFLSYNQLGSTAAKALAQLMLTSSSELAENGKGLLELDLSSNQITADGAAVIADALSQPECKLQRLVLSHSDLFDVGATALAQALQHNHSLQHLDLSNTGMAEKGIIALAATLADHNTTINSLCISSPLLQQRPQHDTTVQLARMLACNKQLQVLQLSKAGLTDTGLEVLVQFGLAKSSTIRHLDLSANRLSSLAGQHVQCLLQSAAGRIQSLNLSSNKLEDAAAQQIAACLPSCQALEHLELSKCSIGDKGLSALLAAAGKAGPTLQTLKLWGNKFGAGSSQALHQLRQQKGKEGLEVDMTTYMVDGVPCVVAKD